VINSFLLKIEFDPFRVETIRVRLGSGDVVTGYLICPPAGTGNRRGLKRNLTWLNRHLTQLSRRLPRLKRRLPRLKRHLTRLKYHLTRLKYHLTRLKYHLTRLKYHLTWLNPHLPRQNYHLNSLKRRPTWSNRQLERFGRRLLQRFLLEVISQQHTHRDRSAIAHRGEEMHLLHAVDY